MTEEQFYAAEKLRAKIRRIDAEKTKAVEKARELLQFPELPYDAGVRIIEAVDKEYSKLLAPLKEELVAL
jgi:hypothetical protein